MSPFPEPRYLSPITSAPLGGPNVNALFVVGWGPGMGAVDLPAHTGVQVTGGYRMILQIHYNTSGAGTAGLTDRSTMDLETTTSGVVQASHLCFA